MTVRDWQRSEPGWVKLNVDGSVSNITSKAAVGRVVRDANGKWLTGLTMAMGMVEVFLVEARGVLEGMKLLWQKGYRQIEVNCDNALLIDTIRNGFAPVSNIREVRLIHEWCKKDWKVKFRHVLRDCNEDVKWDFQPDIYS